MLDSLHTNDTVTFAGSWFGSGYEFLISALLSKNLLPLVYVNGIYTRIIFDSADKVVVRREGNITDEYSIRAFSEKYNAFDIETGDNKSIRRVDIYVKGSGAFDGCVKILNLPGYDFVNDGMKKESRTDVEAVIYVVSATKLWEYEDRVYIHEHYDNREMSNVFFVINKMNLVNTAEEVEKIKNY